MEIIFYWHHNLYAYIPRVSQLKDMISSHCGKGCVPNGQHLLYVNMYRCAVGGWCENIQVCLSADTPHID